VSFSTTRIGTSACRWQNSLIIIATKVAPFEALYGRRCRTPLSWSQTSERKIFGPDLVIEAEGTHARQKNRGARGLEEEDRGPSCEKQKTQGPYCKAWTTFTPLLK
jgi:hypothetical protein